MGRSLPLTRVLLKTRFHEQKPILCDSAVYICLDSNRTTFQDGDFGSFHRDALEA